jgi:hypothetical protein
MERQVWVDFNEQDAEGRAPTLTRFAEPGVELTVGARVVAGDDEGNRCWAEVVDVSADGVVALDLDAGTFQACDTLAELAV